MKHALNRSIRRRLMLVIMRVAAFTLLVAFLLFGALDGFAYKRQMVEDLTANTDIIAANTAAALIFEDASAAEETLASLGDRDHILAACVYDIGKNVLATYDQAGPDATRSWPTVEQAGHRFADRKLYVFHPVVLDGEPLGTVYLEASQVPLYNRLVKQAQVAALVLLVSLFLAYGLTTRLQRGITEPIIDLADTARIVSEDKDYSVRATRSSEDEVGMLIDAFNEMLSEIEQRDEALSSSEEYFRSLIENGSDIIILTNKQGCIQYASPSACRLLKQEAATLIGKALFEFVHPEDQAGARNLLRATPGEVYTNEYRFGPDADRNIVLESVASNLLDQPAVQGIVINSRDITERKQAEEQLQTFARNLEQSNRELQDFAHVASHDLQEPLRKIQAFGDRLQVKCGDSLGEQGADYLARMSNAAQRMQELITSLLEFSRVTSQARPYAPVDLDQIVREVLGDLEIAIERSGTTVELENLPVIDADPMHMRQLFQNLIGNAVKFHREGVEPLITVSADAPRNGRIELRVADNGIGFDAKYQERIFGIFQRLHGRSEFEGTGVGLSICRKIVDRHQGEIVADSTPGEGTTFIITLPVQQEQTGVAA